MERFRIAALDLNNGEANEGMRCIRQLSEQFFVRKGLKIDYTIFDVRQGDTLPAYDEFDVYISSGGPGSPYLEGHQWEKDYFKLVDDIYQHNEQNKDKIHFFAICHSFQLLIQHFDLAEVSKRRSTSFGVMPVHMELGAEEEPLFEGLSDPFWAVDSRDYQIVQPKTENLKKIGAKIVCLEKIRPHVNLERAVMGIRFSNEFFGTQFHPEADAEGMHKHFSKKDKKDIVIANYGEEKFFSMLEQLEDPEKIALTEATIIPGFLEKAFHQKYEPVLDHD